MKLQLSAFQFSLTLTAAVVISLLTAPVTAADFEVVLSPRSATVPLPPAEQPTAVQLVLDDSSSESDLGVVTSNGNAKQFLWFNRFSSATFPIELEQISVLFPPGANMMVNSPVQLVIYEDPDGDPSNGASLVTTIDEVVQVVDGETFSVYDLVPPVSLAGDGDVLIGVVNRFVTSGVTTTTQPAAIDTGSSQARSWLAVWTGDPPDPPSLPADGLYGLVDRFEPGNWMIRAAGTSQQPQPQPPAIPVTAGAGLLCLVLLTLAGGWLLARR